VTATIEASQLVKLTKATPLTLSLGLLDPQIVLQYLQKRYSKHDLLKDVVVGNKHHRWWWTLLHDIGVVPIFLERIEAALHVQGSNEV
jgi:hypothetical protein